jgi:hypothetical protein
MKNLKLIIPVLALVVWFAFAATPQPSKHSHIYNTSPTRNITTGVLTLSAVPKPPTSILLYANGIRQTPIEDFTLSGSTVTPVAANISLYADPATILTADFDQ